MSLLKLCPTLLFMTAAIAAKGQGKATSQISRHQNTVWFELGGPGSLYSLNYQHNFCVSKNMALGIGAYVMPYLSDFRRYSSEVTSFGGQLQALYLVGYNEFGVGVAFTRLGYGSRNESYKSWQSFAFGQLTYGRTFRNGFYSGIALTPILTINGKSEFTPWGGLRFGYRFR